MLFLVLHGVGVGSDASFMIVLQRSYGLGFVSCKVFKEMGKTIPGSAPSVGRWPVNSRKSAVIDATDIIGWSAHFRFHGVVNVLDQGGVLSPLGKYSSCRLLYVSHRHSLAADRLTKR